MKSLAFLALNASLGQKLVQMSRFLNGMGIFSIWGVPEFRIIPIVELVGPGFFRKKHASNATRFQRRFGVQDLQLLWFFLRTKQTWIWAEARMLQAHSRKAWVWSDQSQLWQFSSPSQFIICFFDSSFLQSSKHPPSQKVTFEKASHRGRFKRGLVVLNDAMCWGFFFRFWEIVGEQEITLDGECVCTTQLKTTLFLVHVLQLKETLTWCKLCEGVKRCWVTLHPSSCRDFASLSFNTACL